LTQVFLRTASLTTLPFQRRELEGSSRLEIWSVTRAVNPARDIQIRRIRSSRDSEVERSENEAGAGDGSQGPSTKRAVEFTYRLG